MLLHVRKARAGSASGGYTWRADGAVVKVPYAVAAELVAIPDGGFTIVDPPADPAVTEPAPVKDEISEAPGSAAAKKAAAPKAVATVKE